MSDDEGFVSSDSADDGFLSADGQLELKRFEASLRKAISRIIIPPHGWTAQKLSRAYCSACGHAEDADWSVLCHCH